MKNELPDIAIEGSCLFGRLNGLSSYTYTLIKSLTETEKEDRFYVWYCDAPLLKRSLIDFKQHNLKHKRPNLPLPAVKELDIYHDTGCFFPSPEIAKSRVTTVRTLPQKTFSHKFRQALDSSDFVIASSQYTKEELIRKYKVPGHKVEVIYEGTGEEFHPQASLRSGLVKTRYRAKRPFLFFLGPIDERKNLQGLFEAYSLLKYESPPDLLIAGEVSRNGPDIKKLAEKFDIVNNVNCLGYIPKKDIACLMSEAVAFLFPALYDCSGLQVLEAMSCGAAVISSENSAIPEITGDAALLTDPRDPQRLADAIRQVLSDKEIRVSLKNKSLERAKYFSAKKMAAETLNIYRRLVAK
ncbi:MAG: glycosyltransferase family 1 protein [Candidatus Margulisiibacteriota bacterium]